MTKRYIIVSAKNHTELEQGVNNKIRSGYRAHGSMQIMHNENTIEYYQPMVKKKDK